MDNKYLWFALGIGATFGAAVALLFAPQSGAKTRKQLSKSLDDAADYIEDAGDYLKAQAGRLSVEAQKMVKQTTDKAAELAESAGELSTAATKSVASMF